MQRDIGARLNRSHLLRAPPSRGRGVPRVRFSNVAFGLQIILGLSKWAKSTFGRSRTHSTISLEFSMGKDTSFPPWESLFLTIRLSSTTIVIIVFPHNIPFHIISNLNNSVYYLHLWKLYLSIYFSFQNILETKQREMERKKNLIETQLFIFIHLCCSSNKSFIFTNLFFLNFKIWNITTTRTDSNLKNHYNKLHCIF